MEGARRGLSRRQPWSWGLAVLGPAAVALVALLPGDDIDLAAVALLLTVIVATALTSATRGPQWVAATASAATFLVARSRVEAGASEHVLAVVAFALLTVLVGELVVAGIRAREQTVHGELRSVRVSCIATAATLGVDPAVLVGLVNHELRDELDAEVRYEPDARSTCHYRIDQNGRLYRHADRLDGRHQRLPAEPVSIPVRDGDRDLGQLVVVPRRPQPADHAQLAMAATIASLLASALGELPTTT